MVQGTLRLRSNKEIFEWIEYLKAPIWKGWLRFYGHMFRMDPLRITNQLLDKIFNL